LILDMNLSPFIPYLHRILMILWYVVQSLTCGSILRLPISSNILTSTTRYWFFRSGDQSNEQTTFESSSFRDWDINRDSEPRKSQLNQVCQFRSNWIECRDAVSEKFDTIDEVTDHWLLSINYRFWLIDTSINQEWNKRLLNFLILIPWLRFPIPIDILSIIDNDYLPISRFCNNFLKVLCLSMSSIVSKSFDLMFRSLLPHFSTWINFRFLPVIAKGRESKLSIFYADSDFESLFQEFGQQQLFFESLLMFPQHFDNFHSPGETEVSKLNIFN
jgi:hypothetical protein